MDADARLATEHEVTAARGARTRITTLRSQPPLSLRPTIAQRPEPWTGGHPDVARVSIAAAAAGPIGGDRFGLHVDVGAGSTLVLRDVSATLLLPGPHGEESRVDVDVHVGAGATLVWLPEPVIAARACRHRSHIHVTLDRGARLLLREELLLGRFGEQPGTVCQSLRVLLDDRPLLHQELAIGSGPGWDGPAVTGGHRAIGALLTVDPAWSGDGPPPAAPLDGDSALLPLRGPAALVSVLADDAVTLRRRLDEGLALLERPRRERSAPPAEGPLAESGGVLT